MLELDFSDARCLLAATGWLELGNEVEARSELGLISEAGRRHVDVLEVRWEICAREQDWEDGVRTAQVFLEVAPGNPSGWVYQAYALRRTAQGGLEQALEALLPAYKRFPKEAVIPFNLACYACQLGRLKAARMWLKRAIAIEGESTITIREMALREPDLKPLWEEIKGL
jgi:tetratricopeptide (TPR) repeat protein